MDIPGAMEAASAIGGLVLPKAMKAIQGRTTESTDPSVLAAQTELLKARVAMYNCDVTKGVSRWVTDLRAAVRPLVVPFAVGVLALNGGHVGPISINLDPGTKAAFVFLVSSWFGDRFR